jgi:hypothetical protein
MLLLPSFLVCSGKNLLRQPIYCSNHLFELYTQIYLSCGIRDFFMGVVVLAIRT